MPTPFSYLDKQFSDIDLYLDDIKKLVLSGDFTLGKELEKFEESFAKISKVNYAIGVASGTEAITLSLKSLGVGPGDEVITTPTTFVSTVGAIVASGAKPVFVDSENGFVIDPSKIEKLITNKTKAIVPVHYTGNVADMPAIMSIANSYKLPVIEDSAQAIGASLRNKPVGSWGSTGCFSFHPLKNLNVWGDAGMIITNSEEIANKLKILRNNGLVNRDEVAIYGHNSRLDTLQAVIGNRLIKTMPLITQSRIDNAMKYDSAFLKLKLPIMPPIRRNGVKHVYHLYMLRCKKRDELLKYLNTNQIEAKIHYPIPMHLQKASSYLGYKEGDFPISEADSKSIITLPAHQHLNDDQIEYTIQTIKDFYCK
ncbi:MAG: DegT/DnrJ/EryC1/StrS family aminotransferase [Dehalococcoidia bacterium]